MTNDLLKLQNEIYDNMVKESGEQPGFSPKISFPKTCSLYEPTYFKDEYDEDSNFALAALIDLTLKHSSKIKSLFFTDTDGTENGDFTKLINLGAVFENLETFRLKLTNMEKHNASIITNSYDEDGQIASIVSKMPNIKTLQILFLNEDFFKPKDLKLNQSVIQIGYNAQNFISNLLKAANLKRLFILDWMDILDDADNIGTAYESCKELFEMQITYEKKTRFYFTLRENRLIPEELQEPALIEPIQILHTKTFGGQYV